jgi:glutamine---fructose-6-phosphate transaminase (isomerizing)
MCGIVGYVGHRDATPLIVDGLRHLEYRGYDSAGVAILQDGQFQIRRDTGRVSDLSRRIEESPVSGTIGIGHTRWATHGRPAEHNAHPHVSMLGDVVLVHNGIVENYLALRDELREQGVEFSSETDTEVIAQMIARILSHDASLDITEATRRAVVRLQGAHVLVVMSVRQPDRLVVVRIGNAGGAAIGVGAGEHFVASDIPAILEHTRDMIFLDSRQIATVTADGVQIETIEGASVAVVHHTIPWDPVSAVKGMHKHFMQKEIHDQPRAISDTLGGRVDFETGAVPLPELNLTDEQATGLEHMVTVACGTSYYSGLVGKFWIERLARLRVEVDYASEYRYRDPIVDARTAMLAITQSGETVDTLSAIQTGKEKGAKVWTIVNAVGSQAMRIADGCIAMNAGPEIGVASTKAFTTSLVDQALLAIALGQKRGLLGETQSRALVHDLSRLPDLVGTALELEQAIARLASDLYKYRDFLFLGRGMHYPVALEGALKLKEISYIHAEGYPAGEMKHGPIALIDEQMPVLAIALQDALYDKMISQIEQAKARGALVIALATEGDERMPRIADHIISLPPLPELFAPVVSVVPLQLLAYHIAVARGADVDQPRNLAKSVTVE